MPKATTKGVDLFQKIQEFVVGLPIDPIHKADSIHQTHGDFRTKLDGNPGFAPYDGSDVWLILLN